MPIIEFCCNSCQHIFEELLLNRADKQQVICPKCGGKKVSRLFSIFGVSGADKRVQSSGKSCGHCSSRNCSSCS